MGGRITVEDFLRNEDKGEEIMLSREEFQSELNKTVEQFNEEELCARNNYQSKRLRLFATRNTQLSERIEELEAKPDLGKENKKLREAISRDYTEHCDLYAKWSNLEEEMFWCKFTLAVSIPVVALITYILTTAIALSN